MVIAMDHRRLLLETLYAVRIAYWVMGRLDLENRALHHIKAVKLAPLPTQRHLDLLFALRIECWCAENFVWEKSIHKQMEHLMAALAKSEPR